MTTRYLTALPVFNEEQHVATVLDHVVRFSPHVLVVDDGSSDGTAELLAARDDILIESHPQNAGYGAALRTAFEYAILHKYQVLVTIDCDGQHEPQRIPEFVAACESDDLRRPDIISGSRYLEPFDGDNEPPEERRRINMKITGELNRRLGLQITDAFCGFKAYRVAALQQLATTEPGYAMPLELWVRAARERLRIVELPVPLIYLEEKRSFGGELDDGRTRLVHYYEVINRSLAEIRADYDCADSRMLCGDVTG